MLKPASLLPPWRVLFLGVLLSTPACEIMPSNSLRDCRQQCPGTPKSRACEEFCACIHSACQSLDSCLTRYDQAPTPAAPPSRADSAPNPPEPRDGQAARGGQ
ncbi:hypothetical protein ACW9KT_20030 [Hymenobacter sp. HD11105]